MMAERSKSVTRRSAQKPAQKTMLCDGLSFAAAEAYKLLRTNLMFSLPDKPCRILGVTSSIRGEGKSTTAVNLAYTLAQAGKRTLLIDADMRLPSVSGKLGIHSRPGLSNLLAGLTEESKALRQSEQLSNWFILPAGDIPPNPSELLGSERMHALLERCSGSFDFIVIDLPPINIVTDALVVSSWTDGLIAVVRQNYTEGKALKDCMYQLKQLGSKFLGFVMTDAMVGKGSYKRYGKYGKYGYDYGYGYGDAGNKATKIDEAFREATMEAAAEPLAGGKHSASNLTDTDD